MIVTLALLLQGATAAPAGPRDPVHGRVTIDTLWSQSLGIRKALVVYVPPTYARVGGRRFPVAYFLHGIFGGETDWTRLGGVHLVMDSLVAAGVPEMIIVMPDGDDGWYTTWNTLPAYDECRRKPPEHEAAETYCVPWPHYDDYIARDVVQFVDRKYRTEPTRAHRGVAGLSMGGYGAISLALEYPDVFAAAASHSGVLAPLLVGPHPFDAHPRWAAGTLALERSYGQLWSRTWPALGRDTASWWARDPGRRLERLIARHGRPSVPALFADVGVDDTMFVDQSRAFRWEVERDGVPLEYHEWPGRHDFTYWRAHVGESLAWLASRIGR